MEPDKPPRLLSVDSLRGIAALSVVFFHLLYVPQPSPTLSNSVLKAIANFGGTGVFLFFVISGFSLCLTMPRHDRFPAPNLSFGMSRLFRIAPAFFFMLIVSIPRDYIFFGSGNSPANFLLSASFLFNLIPRHQEGIVWASWTVGVEMLFYASFLPLYRLGVRWQIIATVVSLVLFGVLSQFISVVYMYLSVLGFIPLFVFGMLTFELYSQLRRTPHQVTLFGWLLIAIGSAILAVCVFENPNDSNLIFRFPVGAGYSAVLLGSVLCEPRFLKSKPLIFYGQISYSLYLVHAPILYACSKLFAAVSAHVPGDLAYAVCAIITLSIATTCAYLMYEFIEKPGIRLGAWLLKMISERSPANFTVARNPNHPPS